MTQGWHPARGQRVTRPHTHGVPLTLALTLTLTLLTAADAQDGEADCCSLATPSCRTLCYQVPVLALAGEESRDAHLARLTAHCPAHLEEFWRCLNDTLAGVAEGAGWWGRPCCRLALAPPCQLACLTDSRAPNLAAACRPSHEIEFFACVNRTEAGAVCCANTQSYRCRASCEAVFAARASTRRLRHQLTRDCGPHSIVSNCARPYTRTTPATRPHTSLHCCLKSDEANCRAVCRTALTSLHHQQDIVDQLESACGKVHLASGMWQCLFRRSEAPQAPEVRQVSRLGQLGLDAARLSCCQRAVSAECRGLCQRAFSREWERSWDALHTSCLTRPQEAALNACLGECEAPCQPGCSGLSFCTNFNHRPSQLFRSCNARADTAARKDLQLWEKSQRLSLPGLATTVPIKSVRECQPDMWRAVACSQHLRPCQAATLTTAVCWHDCVVLLSRCLLTPEGGKEGLTAGAVCGVLSPPLGDPCVPLGPFLSPSPLPNEPPWRSPTTPCRPDPCPPSSLCQVERECGPGQPCRPYRCVPACPLGEVSNVAVPTGAFVLVPDREVAAGCGQVCRCGAEGELGACRYLACVDPAPCWLATSKFEHATEVVVGCKVCVCHAGSLTCLPRSHCPSHLLSALPPHTGAGPGVMSRGAGAGTDCACADTWAPVCTSHGRTFPSACLARCAGLEEGQWSAGACGAEACVGVACGRGEQCVPTPATCLTPPDMPCPQHLCVPMGGECPAAAMWAACDTRGRQYPSLCHLVRAGATLAYPGPCSTRCSPEGEVCGRDGRTWASECQARAFRVPVDYPGACRAVGVPDDACAGVVCPHQSNRRCVGVSWPGWCCGRVCGGGLLLAWSQRRVQVAAVAIPHHRLFTVSALLEALEAQLAVSECNVEGHLTLEGHLLVLVRPSAEPAPPMVAEACVQEAERLAGAVWARSPRLVSALPASALILATPVHANRAPALPPPTLAFVVALVLFLVTQL